MPQLKDAGVAVGAVEFILGRSWRCSSILATLVLAFLVQLVHSVHVVFWASKASKAGSNKCQFHPIQEERGLVSIYL